MNPVLERHGQIPPVRFRRVPTGSHDAEGKGICREDPVGLAPPPAPSAGTPSSGGYRVPVWEGPGQGADTAAGLFRCPDVETLSGPAVDIALEQPETRSCGISASPNTPASARPRRPAWPRRWSTRPPATRGRWPWPGCPSLSGWPSRGRRGNCRGGPPGSLGGRPQVGVLQADGVKTGKRKPSSIFSRAS